MSGEDAIIYDGEAKVTQKTTYEVIYCEGGKPLAVAEFRRKEDAEAYAAALNERSRKCGHFKGEQG